MRPHVKMMIGNYLTFQEKSQESGGTSSCKLCESGNPETLCHLISSCITLCQERSRLIDDYDELFRQTGNMMIMSDFSHNEETLTQFVLDPTSLNLSRRVSMTDPNLPQFFRLSRNFCYLVDKRRREKLGETK